MQILHAIANTAVSLVIHEFLDKNPDVKDIEKKDVDAKVDHETL